MKQQCIHKKLDSYLQNEVLNVMCLVLFFQWNIHKNPTWHTRKNDPSSCALIASWISFNLGRWTPATFSFLQKSNLLVLMFQTWDERKYRKCSKHTPISSHWYMIYIYICIYIHIYIYAPWSKYDLWFYNHRTIIWKNLTADKWPVGATMAHIHGCLKFGYSPPRLAMQWENDSIPSESVFTTSFKQTCIKINHGQYCYKMAVPPNHPFE